MRPENREAGWYVRRIRRRAAIELGLCLVLAPRVVCAQTDAKRDRPREGDLLVAIDGTTPEPLKPDDVPPSGKLTMAWPLDPTDNTVRDGSRLNKVLLLRLDPESLDPVTRDRAAEGVVAYSAICTHAGCDVIVWHPEARRLECPCHDIETGNRAGPRFEAACRPPFTAHARREGEFALPDQQRRQLCSVLCPGNRSHGSCG